MTTCAKLATAFAAGAILLTGAAAPAMAASTMTEAFVANIRPNIDYLDRSSRLALTVSPSPSVRAFARTEATEQTIAANSLVAWWQANTAPGAAVAVGEPVTSGVLVAPLDTAAALTAGAVDTADGVVTGRSVALDRPLTVTPAPRAVGSGGEPLLPAGSDDYARLSTMTGARFDAFYRTTQRDSLRQLATLYTAYIQNGDDPGLRGLAVRELPKINRRLVELRRL